MRITFVVLIAALPGCQGTTTTTGDTGHDPAGDAVDTLVDTVADTPVDSVADTSIDPDPDVPPVDCARWVLGELSASAIHLQDPWWINTERTFRVAMTVSMSRCQKRAMTAVDIDATSMTATITVHAWDGIGMDCPTVIWDDWRYVALRLPAVGTWTIVDGSAAGGESITVDVEGGPPRACGITGNCEMDCDCPHDGTVCLGGWGVAGEFASCAHPCEDDMDCMNGGRCESWDDGLDKVCHNDRPQCDDENPCPTGYVCEAGWCNADFMLSMSARAVCTCDDDCTAPLACTTDAPDAASGRCELLCTTGSTRWCSGGHFCGTASQDVAGIALTDSVCVWWGE